MMANAERVLFEGKHWALVAFKKNECWQASFWWYEPNKDTAITASNYNSF